jgi:hypothetical protein
MVKTIFGEKNIVALPRDMEELGIQPQLWLQQTTNGNYIKPIVVHVITN